MRIPSGSTDRYVYFYAVDENDKSTPETGLSSFTVYRSRNGGVAAAMTIPTINETDATNMQGVYELLLDEDTTIGAGNDTEEMVLHITHAGMQTVVRSVELYRPETTEGETVGVSGGAVSNVTTVATTTTNTDMRGTDAALLAASAPTNFSDLAITVTTGQVTVGTNNDKTGYSISGTKTTLDALNDVSTAQVNTEVDTALADYDPPTKAEMDAGFAALNDPTAAAVADAVWDEDISSHLVANSFGRQLWVAGAIIQDTTATGTPTTTTLQLSAGSTSDDYYNDLQIVPKDGNANGQARIVTDYVGATKTITIDEAWSTAPSSGDAILIRAIHNHTITQLNTEISDSVLDEALSGHTTAGTLGKAVADIETDVTAILADTADMQPKLGTPAADISADIAAVKVDSAAILVDTADMQPKLGTPAADLAADIAAVPTATENADALLNRDMSAVSDTNSRSPLNAMRLLRNKWTSSAGTLTVYEEDDATSAWTAALTGDATADPVTGSDPV